MADILVFALVAVDVHLEARCKPAVLPDKCSRQKANNHLRERPTSNAWSPSLRESMATHDRFLSECGGTES